MSPVENLPDRSVVEARHAFMSALLGDDATDSALSSPSSRIRVSTLSTPAVVPANEETMRKLEERLNANFTSSHLSATGDAQAQDAAESVGEPLGFSVLEPNEESTGFIETTVDIEADAELMARIEALLPGQEVHTGAPEAPAAFEADAQQMRRALGVVGADGRTQVSCGSAHSNFDFKQVVAFHSAGSDWAFCSGTLIGPDVVLTAAHCIHDKDDGGWQWPDRVSVQSCSSSDTWREYQPRQMWTWTKWTRDQNMEYDMAIVRLHSAPNYQKPSWFRWLYAKKHAGDLFGWKSFGYDTGMSTSWWVTIVGYPADKQRSHGFSTMWQDTDDLCKRSDDNDCRGNPKTNFVRHMVDTWGAQSGSGMFKTFGTNAHRIYGVHAYSLDCARDSYGNIDRSNCDYGGGAPRITRSRFLQMCAFIDNSRVC